MKRFWLTLSILILAFSQSCATDKKSAVEKLIHAKDPIEAMRFPVKPSASMDADKRKQEEPIIEIKVGDEISQQEIIDPEVLDAIPDKPVIKQVQTQANKVRLRKGPGLQYKIIGSAYKGDKFTLLGIQKDPESRQSWYMINDQDDKKYFISSILAKVIETQKEPSDSKEDLSNLKMDKVSTGKSILQKRQVQTSRQYRKLIDPTPPLPPELKKAKHITLNFEGTEIYDVITTFCELLKIDYFIEGGIQGKVTLQTFNKIPVEDLYVVLEQILALHNVTVVPSGHFYRFLPIKDATQKPMSLHYGYDSAIPAKERLIIEIIPLKHISPDSMKKIITPLLTKNASFIDIPDTSNLMLIEMAYNVKRILNVVTALDIDKLSSSDIQLYKIENADSETVVEELKEVFSSMGYESALGNSLSFLSLDRLNSILVVNAFESILPTIDFWIDKLDQPITKGDISTYVYYVQHGDAVALSGLLNSIFLQRDDPNVNRPGQTQTSQRNQKDQRNQRKQTDRITQQDSQKRKTTGTQRQQQNQRSTQVSTTGGMSDSLEGEITIIPDQDTNSLIVRTSPRNYPSVLEIIKKLDLFPQQVLIEVLILDLTLDEETESGLEWALQGTTGGTKLAGGVAKTTTVPTLGSTIGTATASFLPGGSFFVGKPGRVIALLQAFSADSKANILANPILVTSDNKPANISITDEIPIENTTFSPTTTTDVRTTTVEFRSVGIKLDILPKINSDNYVNLQISQEISSVGADQSFGTTSSPSFLTRQMNTEVVLKDNQILVMGGLIRTDITESSEGLPWLREIPFIGKLFGTESRETKKTELMIFITPHIISNDEDSEFVTDQFRKRLGNIKTNPSNS